MTDSLKLRIWIKVFILSFAVLIFLFSTSCAPKIMSGKQTVAKLQKQHSFNGYKIKK